MAPTIYLLHFAEKYHHAQHYIGYTEDLAQRLARHQAGNGSPLVAAVVARGIEITLARTWSGGRDLERRLKAKKATPRLLCPICRGETND